MWQTASDFIVFVGWLWHNLTTLLRAVFLPVQYIYTFLKEFFYTAFQPPIIPESIWTFDTGTKEVFASIPYFNVLISVAISGIIIVMVVFILKSFQRS